MRKLKDLKLKSKRVLVRCDFNVPLRDGKILDDYRIRMTIPTIEYLIKKRAKVILMSHLGRPKGREKKYSLKPVAKKLESLLKRKVKLLKNCLGKEVEKEIGKMEDGEIVLLENLRFHKEEKEGDENFAKKLSRFGDIFIQEAFACCHREHASIVKIPKYLPSAMGFLLEREIKNLEKIIKNPKKPLITIFGGKEVHPKVIDQISKIADFVLVSHLIAKEIFKKKIKLKYPRRILFPIDGIDKKGENFDIGEKTIKFFKEKIKKAKTIFWSGPLGKIEEKKFQKGTKEIAKAIAKSKAFSVVGGGQTVDFIRDLGLEKKFSFVSTGGNAVLDFLADGKLPGIDALKCSK